MPPNAFQTLVRRTHARVQDALKVAEADESDGSVYVPKPGLAYGGTTLAYDHATKLLAYIDHRLQKAYVKEHGIDASSSPREQLLFICSLHRIPGFAAEDLLVSAFKNHWDSLTEDEHRAWLVQRRIAAPLVDAIVRDGFIDTTVVSGLDLRVPAEGAGAALAALARDLHDRCYDDRSNLTDLVTRAAWDRVPQSERPLFLAGLGIPSSLAEALYADGTLSYKAPDAARGLLRTAGDGRPPAGAVGESPTGARFAVDSMDDETIQISGYLGDRYQGSRLYSLDSRRMEPEGPPFWDNAQLPLLQRNAIATNHIAPPDEPIAIFDKLSIDTVRAMHRFALLDEQRLEEAQAQQRSSQRTVRPPRIESLNSVHLNALGIRPETLDAPQFRGAFCETLRADPSSPKAQAVVTFPVTRWPAQAAAIPPGGDDRPGVVSYELVGAGPLWTPPAHSGFWESSATGTRFDRLIIVERAIDALAYHQLHPNEKARYLSVGGTLDKAQALLLSTGSPLTPEGPRPLDSITVVLAFGRDRRGTALKNAVLDALPPSLAREKIEHQCPARGTWTEILQGTERDYIRSVTHDLAPARVPACALRY